MKPSWIFFLALATACAPSNGHAPTPLTADFQTAIYHNDCAPWDGPALTLVFATDPGEGAQPSYPYMRVSTFQRPAVLPGSSFEWQGTDHTKGYAELCRTADSCEAPHAVHVDLIGVDESGRLDGEVSVQLADGREIAGPFSAEPVPLSFRCG